MTAPAPLQRYEVWARHPHKDRGFTVELAASSERFALSRVRVTLMHHERDHEWLDAYCEVLSVTPL